MDEGIEEEMDGIEEEMDEGIDDGMEEVYADTRDYPAEW
jgi:hypothetical protein